MRSASTCEDETLKEMQKYHNQCKVSHNLQQAERVVRENEKKNK